MNYLAHILLSHPDESQMLGNFLGDFVRTKELVSLPSEVQKGVHLHRLIDTYTDSHLAFRAATDRLRPSLGKYAPVAMDIVNDHILCRNWSKYSDISLRMFCDRFYKNMIDNRNIIPYKLAIKVDIMLEHDFLMATSNTIGLYKSLEHMDRRARFDSNFTAAHDILERNYSRFQSLFNELMTDLIKDISCLVH